MTLVELFSADMLRRNRSPLTRIAYERDLAMFGRWFGQPIESATRKDINRYTLYLLQERKYKANSASRNISTLKAFFKYLRREGVCPVNPAEDVDLPKPDQRRPKALRVPEAVLLLNTERHHTNHIRDRAIIELLYGSGLRRAELAGVSLDDVDFVQRFATVRGKGNKQRIVLLTEASISAMQVYLHVRPCVEDRAFFLSNRKARLGLRQVWKIVKDHARAAGLPKVSTHWMRHSFATHYIEAGGDLSSLQRLMGHEAVTTTQIYVDQTPQHLRKQFLEFSMRDKADFGKS